MADSATVCWNAIVKNEAKIIRRCMDALADHIDYWVVVDTGSTDGTQDIIEEYMAERGIPGELYDRPWVNFGENRSQALRLAENKADYLLLCDADMVLEVHDPKWREQLADDAYTVLQRHGDQGLRYRNMRLINARLSGPKRWRYRGSTHEFCDNMTSAAVKSKPFNAVEFVDRGDGGSKAEKFTRDIGLLENDLKEFDRLNKAVRERPDDEQLKAEFKEAKQLLPRVLFYLGQSYLDDGKHLERAIVAYKKRIQLGGWKQEVFYSYYRIGQCLERLKRDTVEIQDAYLKAFQVEPTRIESLLKLVRHYHAKKQYHLGWLIASTAKDMPMPEGLFIEAATYKHRMRDEYSVACFWTRRYQEAIAACRGLLADPDVPKREHERILRNLNHSLKAIGEPEEVLKTA